MKRTAYLTPIVALALLLLPVQAVESQEEHAFVGVQGCKKCHLKEWKSWQETKMAEAFESLKPGVDVEAKEKLGFDPQKDYSADAECVGCHVTGWEQPGGFTSTEETPDLAGVGCEDCHGAGGTYIQDGYMTLKNKEYKRSELVAVGLVEKVGVEQCMRCHDPEKVPFDYTFDYESQKDQGMHEKFPLKYNHD